jgi:hypothetical protein
MGSKLIKQISPQRDHSWGTESDESETNASKRKPNRAHSDFTIFLNIITRLISNDWPRLATPLVVNNVSFQCMVGVITLFLSVFLLFYYVPRADRLIMHIFIGPSPLPFARFDLWIMDELAKLVPGGNGPEVWAKFHCLAFINFLL